MTEIAQALAQSQENSKQIENLRTDFVRAMGELGSRLEKAIGEFRAEIKTVERSTHPNAAVLASWAAVILMLVGIVGTGMFFYINKRFELGEEGRRENFQQINTRIERLENNADDLVRDELRRYRDLQQEKLK